MKAENPTRRFTIYDIVVISFLMITVFVLIMLAKRWSAPFVPKAHISLNPIYLPKYTFFSMSRGFIAYFISLFFTLTVGYLAAKNRYMEKIIIPALDIFQSVPVLGFLPGLMLALLSLFPHTEIGLELVSIIMIFTGQVWNMTFSFYQSLKSTPKELIEAAKIYNMSKWGIFWNVEVPYSMSGLVWNSMMSMAGGWFFLTVCEAFTLGNQTYTIPGIGSYMALAINKGYVAGQIYGIVAMVLMIVFIDVLFWKPIVAWSSKFSLKEESEKDSGSIILDILVNSHVTRFFREVLLEKITPLGLGRRKKTKSESVDISKKPNTVTDAIFYMFLGIFVAFAVYKFYDLIKAINWKEIKTILLCDGITAMRVYISIFLSVLWALPVGIVIGKNKRISSKLQPVIQILASFPAPLIYPWFVIMFPKLNYSSVLLMMLGTQWYILFNVIAGASTVPHVLEEASNMLGIKGVKKMFNLYIPVVFPYLITGIITAAGGAWNASIVAEYMSIKGKIYQATGIGALINNFTDMGRMHLLAVSIIVMSLSVVLINRLVWRPLQRYAAERFSLE